MLPVLLPYVSQYAPHLYCNTPPICIAVLLWENLGGCGHRDVPHKTHRTLEGGGGDSSRKLPLETFGHGEVRVYRGTGVSRGVRPTTWDRSLKKWELQFPCFEEFFWGENTLGLVPSSLPHSLGYACTLYTPTFPSPKKLGPLTPKLSVSFIESL